MSILLSGTGNTGNCTVTICHSQTTNVKEICLTADIIIAAIGRPEYVTEDMVKEGAVVIDVGITRVPDATKKSGFKLKGDVDYEKVAPKCSYITPVPGGVGPMTIAALLKNTFRACAIKKYELEGIV
jgi:methylenetetrahydrofolate dehydrogenase (NADP+)/methenyltetrahydrofolate cyclohydrolase